MLMWGHECSCGTTAPGCPVERSSTAFFVTGAKPVTGSVAPALFRTISLTPIPKPAILSLHALLFDNLIAMRYKSQECNILRACGPLLLAFGDGRHSKSFGWNILQISYLFSIF
jgi:hypothetical protein